MDIVRLMFLSRQMKSRRHEKDNMVTGIPPLTFTAKKTGTLKNYRIYGNTVDGESVGDKTGNLFDNGITIENGTINTETGAESAYQASKRVRTSFIGFLSAGTYTINVDGANKVNCIALYSSQTPDDYIGTASGTALFPKSFTLNEGGYIRIAFSRTDNSDISPYDISNIMLNSGSTALPYEPYGYKIPVTLTADSAETTDIYLDEPLAKSGDIADYIDYATQKRRNSDGTESSVTLPEIAVAVGTNTLTVGTEVQPSRVELMGRIKEGES